MSAMFARWCACTLSAAEPWRMGRGPGVPSRGQPAVAYGKRCTNSGMVRRNGQREAVAVERGLEREAVQLGVKPSAIESGHGMAAVEAG